MLDALFQSRPVRASPHDQLWMIQMIEFLTVLSNALPCERCRSNCKMFVQLNPVANNVNERREVQNWMQAHKQSHR